VLKSFALLFQQVHDGVFQAVQSGEKGGVLNRKSAKGVQGFSPDSWGNRRYLNRKGAKDAKGFVVFFLIGRDQSGKRKHFGVWGHLEMLL